MNQGEALPRDIINWLDSLDLAYSVKNVRRDLTNGFIIAEILSRYYPLEVNIYTFDNGQRMDRRRDNWEQIAKLLNKKSFNISAKDYEPIYNQAKDASFVFLCKLYEFITRKKLNLDKRPKVQEEQPLPEYMRPTAALLARERELVRIIDFEEKQTRTKQIIQKHDENIRQDKQNSNIKEYLTFKKRQQLEEQLRKEEEELMERKKKYNSNLQESLQPEVREIQLKSYNSSTSKKNKEQQGQLMEAKGILDFLQDQSSTLFKKDPIASDIKNLNIDEKKPLFLVDLFTRCDEVSKKTLKILIQSFMDNNLPLIIETLNNNFLDFKKFFTMFIPLLKFFNYTEEEYSLTLVLFKRVAKELVEADGQSTQMMFENILLEPLIDIIIKSGNKKESLCEILYKFCSRDSLSRYHLITQIQKILKSDLKNFVSILSFLICEYYDDDFNDELYHIFFTYSVKQLSSMCPISRVNSLKIINEICFYNYKPSLTLIDNLNRLISDNWWEIKAQILIICQKLLLFIAKEEEEFQEIEKQEGQLSQEIAEERNICYQRRDKLMNIVYSIFDKHESQNILRIGLIYLAPVLNYYPVLCDRYLDILLRIQQSIREQVLLTNPTKGEAYGQIVGGCNSFKYKLTSAPIEWNSVGIAQSLDSYVQQMNLKEFNKEHLEIIIGCLHNQLLEKDSEIWIYIFNKLKNYIFLSLLEKEMCSLASEIIKRMFLFNTIQQRILEDSKSLFLRLIIFTYDPDTDSSCKDNLLELFEFLNLQGNQFKDYTYQIIKDFSEQQKEKFLKSNLVEFMNNLARERKHKEYGEVYFA